MAKTIKTVEDFQKYFSAVAKRAGGEEFYDVDVVIFNIASALLRYKDENKPIKVFMREGDTKNVCWFYGGGDRYCLAYNHSHHGIELREESTQGRVLYVFNNDTSLERVLSTFKGLTE